jgi:ABC-type uncharacterized transport system fused permease/ATPase subunit
MLTYADLCRVVLAKPSVVILDESTSALGLGDEATIYRLLQDLNITVLVCVCERERERDRDTETETEMACRGERQKQGGGQRLEA